MLQTDGAHYGVLRWVCAAARRARGAPENVPSLWHGAEFARMSHYLHAICVDASFEQRSSLPSNAWGSVFGPGL